MDLPKAYQKDIMQNYKIKEKERRKNRVYKIATKTLCQKGYDRTTIRDIAKATEMTTAGLYYYFKSKEELLFQILNGRMDDMLTGIEKIPQTNISPLELIKIYVRYQLDSYCNDKYRTKLTLTDDECLNNKWYKQIYEKQKRYLSYWKRALERYCSQEGIPTDDVSIDVHCIIGMCNWTYRWYDPKGKIKPEDMALRFFETFIFGLSNRGKGV